MAAQQQYDNNMTGVLFPVKEKKNPNGPDVTGTGTIDGKEVRIAGWRKTTKADGSPFYSLRFEYAEPSSKGKGSGRAKSTPAPASEDEPF